MKVKLKDDDRPSSQPGVSGAGFSHRCLLVGLGTTRDKKVGQKAFHTYSNSNVFKITALLLIQRSFSTGMAKLKVFSHLDVSYLSLGHNIFLFLSLGLNILRD